MVDAVLPDLSGMIAETVDVGVAVAEIDMIHFLIHEEGHVRTPGKLKTAELLRIRSWFPAIMTTWTAGMVLNK